MLTLALRGREYEEVKDVERKNPANGTIVGVCTGTAALILGIWRLLM